LGTTEKKDISIIPTIFPGSVGLSNPLSKIKFQQPKQQISKPEITLKISNNNVKKRSTRPQGTVIDSTVIQSSVNSDVTKPQIFPNAAEIVRNAPLA
jgi:hypothetical protein